MTNVLRVVKEKKDLTDLKPLSWVRLNNKQANFKGDICQLIYNAVKEKKLLLKLIPRLDYTTRRGTKRSTAGSTALSKAATSTTKRQQPDRKKFNVEDLRAVGGNVDFGDNKFAKFEKKWYSRTGFLYYTFSYDAVQAVVTPSMAEAVEFEDADVEDIQLAFKVTSGLGGQFIEVDQNEIAVMPEQIELEAPIESEASKQENYFIITESERTASATSTASASNPSTNPPIEGSTTVDYTATSSSNRHKEGGGDRLLGRLVQVIVGPDIGKLGKVTRVTESAVYVQLSPADCAIPFYRCHIKVWMSAPEVSSPSDSPTSHTLYPPAEMTRKSLSPEDESLWYNLWYLDRLPENLYEGNETYDNLEEFFQFNEELKPDDKSSATSELSDRKTDSQPTSTKKPDYHPGSWVRILRGHYQNDLAQVVSIKENLLVLKLIPRIDYDRVGGELFPAESKGAAKPKSKKRPDAKLFDKEKVLAKGGSIDIDNESIKFAGEVYRSGFLIKMFSTAGVRTENPPLTEAAYFLHPKANEPANNEISSASSRIPLDDAINPPHDGSSTLKYAGMKRGSSRGSQSGCSKDPNDSTTLSQRPNVFGNVDNNWNQMSRNSLILEATYPLDSPTPPAATATTPQSEGRVTSYVAGSSSRTPMLSSSTRRLVAMAHGSSSPAQPDRAWYHTTTNNSSRTLNVNKKSINCNIPMQGVGMGGISSRDWYTTGIQVRFGPNSKNANQIGVIRGMSGKSASVFLLSDRRVVNVAGDLLEPVVPNRHDRVKIIRGDQCRGETGALIQVDQQRGRVRLDSSGEEEMFQLRNLCKMPKLR